MTETALDPRLNGQIRYAQDMEREGMLHARLLRSPLPHARIISIRVGDLPPGVVALTRDDVGDYEPRCGFMVRDQEIVCTDVVRHVGDVVAAVAAPTEREAEEALDRIEVEYGELPGVYDAVEAMDPSAPEVQPGIEFPPDLRPAGHNVCHRYRLVSGRGEDGFDEAEVIVEDEFFVAAAAHVPMEPHATLAWWEAGRLHVVTGTQTPFNVRHDLAHLFKIAEADVRVVVPPMGGSFGAKTFLRLEPVVAALARKAGRPVRAVLTRPEVFLTLTRHAARFRIRLGARRDGTLVAKRVEAFWDTGAYADAGPSVCTKGGYAAVGPYRIPSVEVDSYCVYTHKPPAGAYRGYAATQAVWASERAMDLLAGRLGIDPLTLRLQNLLQEGEPFATGEVMHDVRFGECLRSAAAAVGWHEGDGGDRRGKGLAVMMKGMQTPSRTEAWVELNTEGEIVIRTGTTDVGQRPGETQKALVAAALGVPADTVRVALNDSDAVPYDTRTTSSRSTFMMAHALPIAADHLRQQIADRLEAAAADLVFGAGRAWVAGSPERGLDLASLAGLRGVGDFATQGGVEPDTGQGIASSHWHQGAAAADVAVDEETGVVTVRAIHSSVYAGRVVDRPGAELQQEGSMICGLGTALYEGLTWDGGQLVNGNLSDYEIPSIADLPPIGYDFIEAGQEAHGLGEMAVPVVPAAIGNAVASLGYGVRDLPITAESLLGDGLRALR
jgi:CO/xanthine dehydrogenase Mo-binding subunit